MLSGICIKTNEKVWVETDTQNCYDQPRVRQAGDEHSRTVIVISLLSQIFTLITSY